MRRLTLKKETLAELTTSELGVVVGGSYPTKYDCTLSFDVCLEISRRACVHSVQADCLPTVGEPCIPTQGC